MAKRRPRTITRRTASQAKGLRRRITPAEEKLWRRLKAKRLFGLKFRRQQPVGPYGVDFYCPSAGLVIEIDGDSHAEQEQRDAVRSAWLEAEGYRVVRFTNKQVHEQFDLVLEEIARQCGALDGED